MQKAAARFDTAYGRASTSCTLNLCRIRLYENSLELTSTGQVSVSSRCECAWRVQGATTAYADTVAPAGPWRQ